MKHSKLIYLVFSKQLTWLWSYFWHFASYLLWYSVSYGQCKHNSHNDDTLWSNMKEYACLSSIKSTFWTIKVKNNHLHLRYFKHKLLLLRIILTFGKQQTLWGCARFYQNHVTSWLCWILSENMNQIILITFNDDF